MESSDKELCNPHLSFDNCSKEVTNMSPLTLQKPRSEGSNKRRKKYIKTDSYALRKRFKNNTLTQFSNEENTLEALYNLLCKPVFVSITKLSILELNKWSEKDLSKIQEKDLSKTQEKDLCKTQEKDLCETQEKDLCETQEKDLCETQEKDLSETQVKRPIEEKDQRFRKRNVQRYVLKRQYKRKQQCDLPNLLKAIKQPCIKLHRIDEVINKIALSFAKATSTKECKTSAQIECVKETQTESEKKTQTESNTSLLESQESQLLSINTDGSLQNCKTKSVATTSHVNEIPQLNECIDSSSSDSFDFEIFRNRSKWRVRRKRLISYDSDTDNDNASDELHKITSKETKRLRTDLSEKTTGVNEVNEEHNIVETECIDENPMLQVEPSEEIDVSDELCNSSNRKNLNVNETVHESQQSPSISKNMFINCDDVQDDDNDSDDNSDDYNENNNFREDSDNDDDYDDADETIEEGNTPNYVPSELNLVCTARDNVPIKLKTFVSMARKKSEDLENKDIQEPMQETFTSDKDFIQKYKLFKELRVFLTRFDSMKNFSNRYSAAEIEQITRTCTNSNVLKSQESNDAVPLKDFRLQESIEPERCVSSSNTCSSSTKNIYLTARETQIESSASLKKSSPNSARNLRIQSEKSPEIRKVCHNLAERFEGSSKERYEQRSINDSVEKSIVSALATESTLLSHSQKCINKTSESSNITEKSGDTLHPSSAIKSSNEKSSINEKIPQTSPTQTSTKLITDVRSPEIVEINTIKGKKKHVARILKKPISITYPKIATKKSASTCYSSIISPLKHKKPIEKKETRSPTYKCIVCDLCFEDYSDLQLHLIIHTQKQDNTLPGLSKDLNVSLKDSEELVPRTSETEILESLETFGQESADETSSKFVTSEDNKQVKKNDASSKSLISKEKKKKRIKSINNSNECSICSQVFPTRTDLAAHIYLHTETELQQAYKLAKQKIDKGESEQKEHVKQAENGNSTVDNTTRVIENISMVNDKEGCEDAQISDKSLVTESSESRVGESTALSESNLESTEFLRKPEKEKITKVESSRKPFTICDCHNKPGTNGNCLQIEIVLLCHTCRVLFRSMKCFETHYRLPEYPVCNQKRLTSGRSPNLFCATCGMIFSSVQDVRHHLEIHARFKKDCTLDFRCNICKVIFLGVGTLFYIHWSKHARDPFWIASEQSFPKHSIMNTKLRKTDSSNTYTEEYIQVAEYVCNYCKLLFVTEDDLKKHVLSCGFNSDQDTAVENSNSTVQNQLIISITCSLCDDIFTERIEFYKHIKDRHNFSSPLFVCISLTSIKMIYICSVCMVVAENLEDFEDHWLNHTVTHVCFTCTRCNKAYRNSLNSFIEHAKEHRTGTNDVLSCIVTYEKAKFICNICNIGFDDFQNLQKHSVIHKINYPELNSKSSQVSKQDSSASASEVNRASGCTESKESDIEMQVEKLLQTEAQQTGKINENCPSRCSTDSDKEKLIRVLEGSEDDSDHELIIDLTKQSEECNESSRGEGNKERQTASNITVDALSIDQTCATSKNNITNTAITNIQAPSKNVTVSDISQNVIPTEVEKTEEILKQLLMENTKSIQNDQVQDTVLTTNEEEPEILTTLPASKKQSPPRPRQGFLRVKTLAELTGSLQICEFCGCTIKGADDLVNHQVCQNALNKNNGRQKTVEKESSSRQLTNSTSEICKILITPPTNLKILPLSSTKTVYQKFILPKTQDTQSCATAISSQQPQRLQTNVNSSSLQSVTSAYHKNLPACNIVRTTTAIPRSAVLKNDGSVPTKVIASTANITGIKKLHPVSCSVNKNKRLSSLPNLIYPRDKQYKYKCKFCDFRSMNVAEGLMHELPGTHSTCKMQTALQAKNRRLSNVDNLPTVSTMNTIQSNPNLNQPPIVNQSGINYASSPICYQYHYTAASSSDNNNQLKQNQQIIPTPSVTGNASSSIYYKNPSHSNGGMSIVINQTTPAVQNIPTIGILQQPAQQQIYQSQVYGEPMTIMDTSYVQQSQNLVGFSGSGDVYQMANTQYDVSNREPTVATYEVRLRSPLPAFVCSYCPKNFISDELLQVHINSDHNFSCNICNLRLYSFQDLSIHKVKHSLI